MSLPTNPAPTPYPDVNALVGALLTGVRAVLGPRLLAFALDGSLALGGFDQDSDIDFVAIIEDGIIFDDGIFDDAISEETFLALQALHDRLAQIDSPWAIQLEGSYLSRRAVRRFDPQFVRYPNIERGKGERLKWADHTAWWNIHRWILRERGIPVYGPHPREFIDPVPPEVLRASTRADLASRKPLLENPAQIGSRGYQSYLVLTLCRARYTLAHGAIASKQAAARWAQEALDPRWRPLIERAWVSRHESGGPPDPADLAETLEMLRDTLHYAASA